MRPTAFPRLGLPRDPARRWTRRPGVYAVLPIEGQLLLTLQDDDRPELQLPGGGIDPGEAPVTALHREVWEETGWRIGAARRIGGFRRFTYMPEYDLWAEKVCTIYLARPVRRLGAPTEPHHSVVLMPPEEAVLRLGNPGDRAMIAHLFGLPRPSGRAALKEIRYVPDAPVR